MQLSSNNSAVTLVETCDLLWPKQTSGCSLYVYQCNGLPRLGCSSQSQEMGVGGDR